MLEKAKLRISKLENNREPFTRILFPYNSQQGDSDEEEDYRFFRQEKSTEKKRHFINETNFDYSNSVRNPGSSLGKTSKLMFEKDEVATHFKNEHKLMLENADLKEKIASKDLEIDSLSKDNDRLRADKTKILESLKSLVLCLEEIRRDTILLVNQQQKESSGRKSKNAENINNLVSRLQENFNICDDMKTLLKYHSNIEADRGYILQQNQYRGLDKPLDIAELSSSNTNEKGTDKLEKLTAENESLKQRVESLLVILQNLRKEYGLPTGQGSMSTKDTIMESQRRLKTLMEENNKLRAQLLDKEKKSQNFTFSLTSQATQEIE